MCLHINGLPKSKESITVDQGTLGQDGGLFCKLVLAACTVTVHGSSFVEAIRWCLFENTYRK